MDKEVGPEYIDREQLKREFQSFQIPSRPTLSGTLLSPLDSKQPTLPLIPDNDLNDDISDIEMPAESSHSRESGRKYLVAKSKPNPPRAASLGSKTRRKADISSKLQRSQYETKRYQNKVQDLQQFVDDLMSEKEAVTISSQDQIDELKRQLNRVRQESEQKEMQLLKEKEAQKLSQKELFETRKMLENRDTQQKQFSTPLASVQPVFLTPENSNFAVPTRLFKDVEDIEIIPRSQSLPAPATSVTINDQPENYNIYDDEEDEYADDFRMVRLV